MDKLAKRLQEIRERGMLNRESTLGPVDTETRTAELSFSSESEYRRWFGVEILDHSTGCCRLERLNDGAALLWNHDWKDQRGVVENARVDTDRKGRCSVRFSRSPAGEQLMQDVADGIVSKVSVGYMVHGLKLVETRNDDEDVYMITDWEPYEVSLVSVPADPSVGVGRSMEKTYVAGDKQMADNGAESTKNPTEVKTMEKILHDGSGNLVRAKVNEAGEIVEVLEVIQRAGEAERVLVAQGANDEKNRVKAITDLGQQYNQRDLALKFIGDGKTPEEFQRALLDELHKRGAKPLSDMPSPNIGLTGSEVRKFSIFRAARALLPNASQADKEAAGFEFECSRAACEQYGKEARGILIPQDVLDRAFNAGGAANSPVGSQTGANLVDTQLLTGSFIEMLRNRTTIMRLGYVMGGLVGNVEIPKQTGGASAYWIGEGGDATEGVPAISQIGLSPKTVAAYTDLTRRLMMQATPDAEGLVRRDLIAAVSQAVDTAGYYGSGADNQPRGLKNYSGINGKDFAAAQPTFAELVDMESLIAADNADVNSMSYVFNAVGRGHCKTTLKFSAAGSDTIWEQGGTVNGYRAEVTNQLIDGDYFFGNFADLIIGLWGGLDMTVDPYSLSKSGGTRIVVFQDVDFVLRRLESFCWGSALVA